MRRSEVCNEMGNHIIVLLIPLSIWLSIGEVAIKSCMYIAYRDYPQGHNFATLLFSYA